MFLVYIDDSGDEHSRCFSAVVIHESVWKECQQKVLGFRRALKASDGMYVTKELHATEFVAGRGQVGAGTVTKGRRNEIFREVLQLVASLPKIRLLNAFAPRHSERFVFEILINRINRTMAEWKSHALIIHDEGKDYTPLVRRMSVYNPVPSRFGSWPDGKTYRNMPIDRIIEDIVFRDSRSSSFIQLADFCAYALFRSEVPLDSKRKYRLHEAFELLAPVCHRAAYGKDQRGLGIIRANERQQ